MDNKKRAVSVLRRSSIETADFFSNPDDKMSRK